MFSVFYLGCKNSLLLRGGENFREIFDGVVPEIKL
jgi:hypothetical protein